MTGSHTKTVLLFESEDNIARAMDHVVTAAGHRCARLAPGDRIVQRVSEDRPDLLMLDVSNGDRAKAMEACQTIRRTPGLSHMKILMLNGSGSDVERRRSLGIGADGVVSLPVRLSELRAEIDRLLEAPEAAEA